MLLYVFVVDHVLLPLYVGHSSLMFAPYLALILMLVISLHLGFLLLPVFW